jgi:hypothetical protein
MAKKKDNYTIVSELIIKNKIQIISFINSVIKNRIESDIKIIIKKGWANEISNNDLYHCHICVPVNISNAPTLINLKNSILIIYHSRERTGAITTKNRNIISRLSSSKPFVDNSKVTVNAEDYKSIEIAQINFSKTSSKRLDFTIKPRRLLLS